MWDDDSYAFTPQFRFLHNYLFLKLPVENKLMLFNNYSFLFFSSQGFLFYDNDDITNQTDFKWPEQFISNMVHTVWMDSPGHGANCK